MSRWLRINEDCIDHPKLLKLPEALRWQWLALLCVASKNDGVLPAIDDVALGLRVTEAKAAEYITRLVKANLIDRVGENFVPHNWTKRQFKSDTSTERVKRYRDKKRNVSYSVSDVPETATVTAPETEQIQKQNTEQIDVAGEAREPLVSDAARDLADELLIIAGHEIRFVPPGWCGAANRVHTWLANGWPRDLILVGAKKATAKHRGGPINTVNFYENAIAEEIARQAAPLPQVEIRQPEKLTVIANGKTERGNIIQAADTLVDKIGSFDAGPGDPNEVRSGAGAANVRLLSKG